jgi:hypothetical protein
MALSQVFGSRIRAKSRFASRLAESDAEKKEDKEPIIGVRGSKAEMQGEGLV